MSALAARIQARRFFPLWSRRMRAKWVLARLRTDQPRVAISVNCHYVQTTFTRSLKY